MSGVSLQTDEHKNPVLSLSQNFHTSKIICYAVYADMHVHMYTPNTLEHKSIS